MDVSIIFVNYKTKDLTINAIKSVIEKTEGLEYEIFVVDNNSQDGSIEVIQDEFKGIDITNPTPKSKISTLPQGEGAPVYVIKNPVNAGFGAANNLAIKQARGKYIFCLNTDTLLINNAIKIMFDFMEKEENQNVGVCGGYLVDGNGKPCFMGGHLPSIQEVFLKFDFLKILKPLHNKYKESLTSEEALKDSDVSSIIGADILFRKSVLEKVGIFDEQFFMYREETDLCKRILDNGYLVKYVPEAKIIHLEGKSSNDSLLANKRFKTSTMLYYKKHYPEYEKLVSIIYVILYLIDWLISKNQNSKELLFFILRGYKE